MIGSGGTIPAGSRWRFLVVTVGLLALVPAAPVAAHTRAGVATDWRSEVVSAPEIEGVSWELYPAGEYLRLSNSSAEVVTVLGYEGEPYLRVGPGGVERNRFSPATYLNQRRDGDVTLPPIADPAEPPEWVRISDEPEVVWFDHRVHHMPGSAEAGAWAVPFETGEGRFQIEGRLTRDPGPAWWAWPALGLVVTGIVLLVATRARSGDTRGAAAVMVAGVATFNLIHIPDEFASLPLAGFDIAYGVLHNVLFIGAGIAGSIVTLRSRTRTWLPLAIASGAVAFHQGVLQVEQLGASQLATLWPPDMIRMAVALSLGQLVWVAALIVAARPTRHRSERAKDPENDGAELHPASSVS